jgi:hypothetical protein
MTYTANYEDPWNRDRKHEGDPIVTHTIKLHISSNTRLEDEQVREVLRRHLRERFKITDIDESKISIE